MHNNKFFSKIDVLPVEEMSKKMARLVVKKLEDMDINMGALNRLYLKASNDIFSS